MLDQLIKGLRVREQVIAKRENNYSNLFEIALKDMDEVYPFMEYGDEGEVTTSADDFCIYFAYQIIIGLSKKGATLQELINLSGCIFLMIRLEGVSNN